MRIKESHPKTQSRNLMPLNKGTWPIQEKIRENSSSSLSAEEYTSSKIRLFRPVHKPQQTISGIHLQWISPFSDNPHLPRLLHSAINIWKLPGMTQDLENLLITPYQTLVAIGQRRKRWLTDSESFWHRLHLFTIRMPLVSLPWVCPQLIPFPYIEFFFIGGQF